MPPSQTDSRSPREVALSVLRDVGLHALNQLAKGADKELQNDAFARIQAFTCLQVQELQNLPNPSLRHFLPKCIRLPHISKDATKWIPLIWVDRHPTGEITLQLVLAGEGRRFGFRWEPPEAGTGASEHDYYHAQPIKSVRRPGGTILSLDLKHGDVCDHFPTFPIDAEDLIHLVDALLVSLYGPKYHQKMISEAALRARVHKSSADRGWHRPRSR